MINGLSVFPIDTPKIVNPSIDPISIPIPTAESRFPQAWERWFLLDFSAISVLNGIQKNPAKKPIENVPIPMPTKEFNKIPVYRMKQAVPLPNEPNRINFLLDFTLSVKYPTNMELIIMPMT